MTEEVLALLQQSPWGLSEAVEGARGVWRRSRVLLRIVEGQQEPERMLLLDFLAAVKFTPQERQGKHAVWADKNWENESLENVVLVTPAGTGDNLPAGRPSQHGIAAPANTKEYQREYRNKNREKIRAANRKYQAKMRAAYNEQKSNNPAVPAPTELTSSEATVAADAAFQELMQKLAQPEGEKQ